MKILYLDCETTGLKPPTHELIQLGVILEIDGRVVLEQCYHSRPTPAGLANVDPKALAVNNLTLDMIAGYPTIEEAHELFVSDLSKHIDKFDPLDKAYPCAYNGGFDLSFIEAWFRNAGDPYLGSYINWRLIDPLVVIRFLDSIGQFPAMDDHKLGTICAFLGVPLPKAHDALSDIRATRAVYYRLSDCVWSLFVR